jgi:hypothetical protein
MSRASKRKSSVPRLRVGGNAEAIMRALLATSNAADLRRMATHPVGRTEIERLQRVAAARVDEFQRYLALAKEVEANFAQALQTGILEA